MFAIVVQICLQIFALDQLLCKFVQDKALCKLLCQNISLQNVVPYNLCTLWTTDMNLCLSLQRHFFIPPALPTISTMYKNKWHKEQFRQKFADAGEGSPLFKERVENCPPEEVLLPGLLPVSSTHPPPLLPPTLSSSSSTSDGPLGSTSAGAGAESGGQVRPCLFLSPCVNSPISVKPHFDKTQPILVHERSHFKLGSIFCILGSKTIFSCENFSKPKLGDGSGCLPIWIWDSTKKLMPKFTPER